MKHFTFILLLLSISCALCQPIDSTLHQLEGVSITTGRLHNEINATSSLQIMNTEKIASIPAVQIADILKLFSGITIKDYGGVGGMKTVAIRGFGSQHTVVAFDGLPLTDCQTGQIDLSKFSLHNVEQISLNSGTEDDIFVPARLLASASTIHIRTLRPSFTEKKPVNLNFRFTGGSFGYINPNIVIENCLYKHKETGRPIVYTSLNVNYLQSKGNYPFTIYYGSNKDSTSREKRTNSDVRMLSIDGNLFVDFNSHSHLNIKLYYNYSRRGLPGAVIFYNSSAKQRLNDDNFFAQIHYEDRIHPKFSYQINAKVNWAKQQYYDPHYLNAAGFLDNKYIQREYYYSHTFLYAPHRIISLSISNDFIFNDLTTNIPHFTKPHRLQILTTLSAFLDTKYIDLRAGILHNGVLNWENGKNHHNLNRFCPMAGFSIRPLLQENFYIRGFYKNIFRLPTFNDLYYNEVGNRNLKPENTHQFDIGITWQHTFLHQKINISTTIDGYYNIVKDKIVAIPNKNLFIWTMLNYGKVHIRGLDATIQFNYQIIKQLGINFHINYSLQKAIDKTSRDSKTYLHQIPYTPLHSGAASITLATDWFNISYTLIVAGKRYTLQQNTPENTLAPYCDHSIAIFKDFLIKRALILGAKFELLNLDDTHYEIIRNYPMPGRSFRITIHIKW